ncbi:MAG: ComEA family DNA-binding protein [Beijerinckiaceae bacterium]|jgi:competence protein ComEA
MHTRRILAALALTASFAGAALAQQAGAGAPATPAAPAAPAAPTVQPVKPPAPPVTATAPAPAPAAQLVDINTADKATLEKLKGVGSARAEAIIKGRPFKGKDELVQKNILPKDVYDGVKDQIVARQKG